MTETPPKIIYTMHRVSKTINGKTLLKDISLSYFYGAKIGVLGLNGSGKSTLLKILAGVDDAFDGQTSMTPGHTLGYLEQEPKLDDNKTVLATVQEAVADTVALLAKYESINEQLGDPNLDADKMTELLDKQSSIQEKIETLGAWDLNDQLEHAMDALRCPPSDALIKNLSGGEKRRVALCRLLLLKPDILLLDEPTNHLDAETVAWLEQHLQRYAGTVIAVTHDRYFLDNVAGWILELDMGKGIPFKGNYTSWLEQKQERLAGEAKVDQQRQRTLERELDWIRQNPKGRQAKSKARIQHYESLLDAGAEARAEEVQIYIPPGPRLGNIVIKAENLAKSFNDQLLFEDVTFNLPPGGIVGIIGPNGAGKTTLFKIICDQEKLDSGELRVGDTVQLAYADQLRATLDNEKTVWQTISGGAEVLTLGKKEVNSRGYLTRYGFKGADQEKKVGILSGGERHRVHLACMLKSGANVLLLDEPTNDLDVNTIRALEDALLDFAGCAVIISHDRWFLDRTANHILAFEGDSQAVWFEGNYSAYEEDYKQRKGIDASRPHRIKYRKMTRG